jgi:hypothetical protein
MSPEMYAKGMNGLWGFVAGACVAMLIGFNWGGWSTASTTQKASDDAVLANRVAICVAQFMGAPNHNGKVKEFQGTDNYQRSDLIEKGGWDKMPGEDKAAFGVAGACVTGLEARIKTGT